MTEHGDHNTSDHNDDAQWEDHPDWADYEGPEPVHVDGAIRHGLIISSTFPAFLLLAMFFVFRWVLIGGERGDSFRTTAFAFAAVGLILGGINLAIRNHLNEQK